MAAFDFDGTLTHGGSVWPFLVALPGTAHRGRRPPPGAAPRCSPRRVLGGRHADGPRRRSSAAPWVACDADEVAGRRPRPSAGPTTAGGPAPTSGPGSSGTGPRATGCVIVSASPELLPRRRWSASSASTPSSPPGWPWVADGRLTGSYDGRNCRGQEKLTRVRQWMKQSMKEPPTGTGPTGTGPTATGPTATGAVLWAYGNSDGDR